MVNKKPRIVIIGAGMAGLTAANKLYTSPNSAQLFELLVVEGGSRIGGRINSSEFCGDRIEQGATWIHGIGGSPIYNIAQEINSLQSQQPWECMDRISEDPITIAEGGYELSPFLVEPISTLYKNLMDYCQGNDTIDDDEILKLCTDNGSVGSFLKQGIEAYWRTKDQNGMKRVGTWNKKSLEEATFAIYESMQRTDTGADDLNTLDYNAESEYIMFPGEEITIAKGYLSVIESLASVLPVNTIQFNRIVERIEWQELQQSSNNKPVKLYFNDGSIISADHVIVTVSLGVLKQGIHKDTSLFNPPLPNTKTSAISRLGYGVVNKVFLQTTNNNKNQTQEQESKNFPFLQMAFHQTPSLQEKNPKLPDWIRRTSSIKPIYSHSKVVLSWFTGKEAIQLESITEEEIRDGFSTTISHFLPTNELKLGKVLRTQWGTNPLFLGSYSFIAVGSNINDMDTLAEPLPSTSPENSNSPAGPALQILFAGEATHRTHYSTTHGAYFSGLREANRLLKYIN